MNKIKHIFQKNRFVAAACILLAACLCVSGVAAYMADADKARNQFTIGGVNVELTEEFNPPEKLTPGVVIEKDVKVTNTGPNSCYVRVLAVFSNSDMGQYCTVDWNTTDWVYNENDSYWYYTKAIIDGEVTTSLFTTITLSEEIPEAAIKDFDMIVYTESYQADGFADYQSAWANYQANKPA